MNKRRAFLAGVMAGMGRARRRFAFIAFLAGVVTGIGLGIIAGLGLGAGLRRKARQVSSESESVDGAGTNSRPSAPTESREAEPTEGEATA